MIENAAKKNRTAPRPQPRRGRRPRHRRSIGRGTTSSDRRPCRCREEVEPRRQAHAARFTGYPPGQSQTAIGAGAGAFGGASAWTTIAALWSINQGDNAWFYDTNAGWKKISPDSDVGLETVNAVAGFAKAFGSAVQYVTDDATGMVTEITCF